MTNIIKYARQAIQNISKRFYDPTDDYWYQAVIPKAKSGVDVSESTSLQNPTVWGCVRVISETIASLPLFIYRRRGDGGKERATDHPLYNLLHFEPNSEMTSFQWREVMMCHVLLWGNHYSYIEQARNGIIMSLWPLRPDRMQLKKVNNRYIYLYRPVDGTDQVEYSPDEILHIPGLGFNGVSGYSVVSMLRDTIGLGMAAEDLVNRFYGNDATPGLIIKHPNRLSKDAHERVQSSWISAHGGLDNKWKPAILEEGMEIQQLTMPLKDAQFLETRKFQVEEICRIFRVPPHLVQDLERSTFSNIEQQSLDFVVNTIRPWLVRLEQGFHFKLLSDQAQKTYFFEFLVDGLLRGDIASRYQAYMTGRNWGWLSANDVRKLENMNPIGPEGDVYLIPLNMIPADKAEDIADAQIKKPKEEPKIEDKLIEEKTEEKKTEEKKTEGEEQSKRNQEIEELTKIQNEASLLRTENEQMKNHIEKTKREGFKRLFEDAVSRVIRRESVAIKRGLQRKDLQSFETYLDGFYAELPEFMSSTLNPCLLGYAQLVNSTQSTNCLGMYIENHIKESKSEIAGWPGIFVYDSTEATLRRNEQGIDDCMNLWMNKRPEMAANCFMEFFSTS